jgi:hypothetical protein
MRRTALVAFAAMLWFGEATFPPAAAAAYIVNTYNGYYTTEAPENYTCVSASALTHINYILGKTTGYSHTTALAWYREVRSATADFHDKYNYTGIEKGLDPRGWAWLLSNHAPTDPAYVFHDYWSSSQLTVNRWITLGIRTTREPVGVLVANGRHGVNVVGFQTNVDPLNPPYSILGFFVIDPWYPNTRITVSGAYIGVRPNYYITSSSWNASWFTPYHDWPYRKATGRYTIWENKYVAVLRAANGSPEPTKTSDTMPLKFSDTFAIPTQKPPSSGSSEPAPAPIYPYSSYRQAVTEGIAANNLDSGAANLGVDLRGVTAGSALTVESTAPGFPSYDLVEVLKGRRVVALAYLTRIAGGLQFGGIAPVSAEYRRASPQAARRAFGRNGVQVSSLKLAWAWSEDSLSPFSPLWRATDTGGRPHFLTPDGKVRDTILAPGGRG